MGSTWSSVLLDLVLGREDGWHGRMTIIAGGLSVDLFEAFKSLPLGSIAIVPAPDLGEAPHLVVGLLQTDTGIVVARPGWSQNPCSSPFRVFNGKVTGDGPWRI